MAITSSNNSFVTFNDPFVNCDGGPTQAALPVADDLSIKFQFKVTDELLPASTILKAAVCSDECEILHNPNYEVIPLCSRWSFVTTEGVLITDDDFPVIIGVYSPAPGQPLLPEGEYTKEEFIELIDTYYETDLPGIDFISCCGDDVPVISNIVLTLNGDVTVEEILLDEFYYSGYVDFPSVDMDGIVNIGECFRYCILDDSDEVLSCSNLFTRIADGCKTTWFTYWNEENAFGFNYITYDILGVTNLVKNSIRLWANFAFPEPVVTENIIRQPNGRYKRTSTVIDDQWRGQTSPLSKAQRDQVTIMLKHDYLYVVNEDAGIDGYMTQIGTPEPIYTQPIRSPLSMLEFNIIYEKNNNVNKNCGSDCGIEVIDDCEGGGVTIPCPDKYDVQFQVPVGTTQPTYQDNNLIGLTRLEVYREGLIQYLISGDYSFDSATGTVTFNPQLTENERVAIWEA